MLDDALSGEARFNTASSGHEDGADGGAAGAVDGGQAVSMVKIVTLGDIDLDIAAVRAAGTQQNGIAVAQG